MLTLLAMEPQKKPEVIELDRYRKAAEARAARQAAAKAKSVTAAGPERMLGSRPNAGLLLILVIAVAAALFILPRLF